MQPFPNTAPARDPAQTTGNTAGMIAHRGRLGGFAGRGLPAAALLLALCLVVYLPGFFTIPPVDRDESRFAQASRQMFESVALPTAERGDAMHAGGLLIPMLQDKPRLNKPPLIYWLQAASAAAFTAGDPMRDAIWMYRVPSLLAAIAAVFITWRVGASMFSPQVGALAAAMLAVCPIVAWEAHQARADMVLLALTTGTMASLWSIYRSHISNEPRRPAWFASLAFWTLLSLGILTKGPITPLVAGLTILALCITTRRWRWLASLRPLPGLLLAAAIVLPWFVLVANKVGPSLYLRTIFDETLGRSLAPKEGHWAPPGYHLVLLPVLFWPGSLLTAAGIAHAFRQSFRRDTPSRWRALRHGIPSPDLFFLAWIIPAWIIFELASTKLPHYAMPLYPAVAILSAKAVVAASRITAPAQWAARLGLGVWLGIGLALWVGVFVLALRLMGGHRAVEPPRWALITTIWPLIVFLPAGWLVMRQRFLDAQPFALIFAALTLGSAFILLPYLSEIWISPALVDTISNAGLAHRPLASVEFQEDSLVFLSRGKAERIEPASLDGWERTHPGGVLIAPIGVARSSPTARLVNTVSGFNYARGRSVDLAIIEVTPKSTP